MTPDSAQTLTDHLSRRGAQQRQTIEILDQIVQSIFVAQSALALDMRDMSDETLRTALADARGLLTDLMAEADNGP